MPRPVLDIDGRLIIRPENVVFPDRDHRYPATIGAPTRSRWLLHAVVTILVLALLIAIGFAIYKYFDGEWEFPTWTWTETCKKTVEFDGFQPGTSKPKYALYDSCKGKVK